MFSIQHCSVAAICVAGVCEMIVIAMRNHNQAVRFLEESLERWAQGTEVSTTRPLNRLWIAC